MDKKQVKLSKTLLYTGLEGSVSLEVIIDHFNETIWATQKTMAQTFDVNVPAISKHLKNIFEEEELDENSVVSKMEITASDGKNYLTKFYNLDAIISVGYRVNSKQATQFRIWATNVLKEYIIKGYALDDELLKKGTRFGKDYFDGLLERIKEIRSSERRFYQKITDIYATSYDYNPKSKLSQEFFAMVQNKLHYAVSGKTAPELIAERASSDKHNMGLTAWEHGPKGKIISKDVTIAKNYLDENELTELDSIVSMYLDYAENQARRHKPMFMKDWASRLDKFLEFNEYDLLDDKGNVSKDNADKIAKEEYQKFRVIQDKEYKSDFDEFLEKLRNSKNSMENFDLLYIFLIYIWVVVIEMIKNFEEYKKYRARSLDNDITLKERKEIRKAMRAFEDNNPSTFEKMQREKFVWSRSDVIIKN